jgi:hypothetical protein
MLFLNSCSSHEEGELLPKDTPYSVVNVQLLKLDISPQDLWSLYFKIILLTCLTWYALAILSPNGNDFHANFLVVPIDKLPFYVLPYTPEPPCFYHQ